MYLHTHVHSYIYIYRCVYMYIHMYLGGCPISKKSVGSRVTDVEPLRPSKQHVANIPSKVVALNRCDLIFVLLLLQPFRRMNSHPVAKI